MHRRRFLRVITGIPFVAYGTVPGITARRTSGILLEAEQFRLCGGWFVDTQFIQIMGGAYLLAHGLGKPVADASTTMQIEKPGPYRLWVRTKNWCSGPWEAPGRFRVLLDGHAVSATFGDADAHWGWQDGGTVQLPKGDITVSLRDLTGFDARCDALYFTPDPEDRPPNDPVELVGWKDAMAGRSWQPAWESDFDVVIVGGGIAGCAAAMAADSQGLKVALIQDRPMLGGNASEEIRVHTLGIYGKGERILKKIDTEHYPNGSPKALEDQEKRTRSMDATSARQFLNHRACGLETEGNRIVSVDAREIGSGAIHRFRAPIFIDCTGDAWLGYWAGAGYRIGRESKTEFNEGWKIYGDLWSPKQPDRRVMGASLLWYSRHSESKTEFPPVPWAEPVAKDYAVTAGEWEWEYSDNDLDQIQDAETIRDHLLRAVYGTFANVRKLPENAELELAWVGYVCGKRESRRLMGDYIYTLDDILTYRRFPDTVVTERRDVDHHYQRKLVGSKYDFLSTAMFKNTGGDYYIPFRCLYSKNIVNLMMAGRCFSCSHIGLGGPRVMKPCGQMGIATGMAAAVCKKHGALPRDVYEQHLNELLALTGYA